MIGRLARQKILEVMRARMDARISRRITLIPLRITYQLFTRKVLARLRKAVKITWRRLNRRVNPFGAWKSLLRKNGQKITLLYVMAHGTKKPYRYGVPPLMVLIIVCPVTISKVSMNLPLVVALDRTILRYLVGSRRRITTI